MKKVFSLLCAVLLVFACLLTACNNNTFVDLGSDPDAETIASVKAETKNIVKTVGEADSSFKLNGVSEFVVDQSDEHAKLNETSSSHMVNKKFELDVDAVTTGNKYDPNEVNLYGQFVSPSGKLYEMPGFWYGDCDRYLDEIDETAEYELTGYSISAPKAVGVIDAFGNTKKPVAKINFNASSGGTQSVGLAMDKSAVIGRENTLAIWLRVGEDFTAAANSKLFIRLYSSAKGNDTYYAIPTSELSTEWKQFTFNYLEDGVYSKVQVENFKDNYSVFVCTGGAETKGSSVKTNYNIKGSVYVSDFTYDNRVQYDTEEVVVSSATLANFVAKDLKKYVAGDVNGTEVISMLGTGTFKLRFRFTEEGEWTYRVMLEKNGDLKSTYTSTVTATANPDEEDAKGLIQVEPTLKRNFMFQDGTPYVPIGENVPYSVDPVRGSYDYESYFPKMSAAGMNFSRTWLTFVGHGVESTEGGVLNFDFRQDKAYQFDHILDMADKYDLYLQIPMIHSGRYREDAVNTSRNWDSSPFNVLNGGYLTKPIEFFTDARAKEDTKKMYRYYIARYSYSRYIMNWELFNEIGHVTDYDEDIGKAWANEMGSYVHATDPYRHLVSMSSATNYSDGCYSAEELDFTSIHSYVWRTEYTQKAASECRRIQQWLNKPCMVGETGASGTSEAVNFNTDPTYQVLRQTAFAPFGGAAAGSMHFWWQRLDQYNLYSNVTPAVELYKLMPDKFIAMPSIVSALEKSDGVNVVYTSKQSISVWGFIDSTSAYVYIMDNRYSYANVNPPANTDTVLSLQNMENGDYTIRLYDTKKGEVFKTVNASASNNVLTYQLDSWSADIALLIEKKA